MTSTNAASDLVLQATASDFLFSGTLLAATFPSGASSGKLLLLQKSASIDVASVRVVWDCDLCPFDPRPHRFSYVFSVPVCLWWHSILATWGQVDISGLTTFQQGLTVSAGGAAIAGSLSTSGTATLAVGGTIAALSPTASLTGASTLTSTQSGQVITCTAGCTLTLPTTPPTGTR